VVTTAIAILLLICAMFCFVQGFADRNASTVTNLCRNPGYPESCYRDRPWCFYGHSQWEYCYVPLCGECKMSRFCSMGFDDSYHCPRAGGWASSLLKLV